MKPLFSTILLLAGVATWTGIAQEPTPISTEQSVAHSATVPISGQAGSAAQLQSAAISIGGVPGSLYPADLIVGNLVQGTVFSESFETSTVGQIPTGWTLNYSGNAIYTTDTTAADGSKSVFMRGRPYWTADLGKNRLKK
jgi:hypothetical protein